MEDKNGEPKIALFIDLDNLALGVREAKYQKFEIQKVLERLREKGKLVVKRAYADWDSFPEYKRSFHEAAVEILDIPRKKISGKNSGDIRMVVDAMDLCYSKDHIQVFVLASGDSDFSPLVSKLKENDKHVIGIGVKDSTSRMLVENCDEFIFYEDLVRKPKRQLARKKGLTKKQEEAFSRLQDAVEALQRENKEILWGSMVKQAIQRKHPEFNETYYGYRSFQNLLEDARKHKIIELEKDARSGSYIIQPG